MKNKFLSILCILAFFFTMLTGCEKVHDSPANIKDPYSSQQKIWPWIISGVIVVVVELSQGQARDVTYHENGNLKSYNCIGVGTCHIAIKDNGNGNPIGESDALYTYDQISTGFEIVSSNRGDVFLRSSLDNPHLRTVFYNQDEWGLSIPYVINDPTAMEILGLQKPLEISGRYQVIEDLDENLMYVKLK